MVNKKLILVLTIIGIVIAIGLIYFSVERMFTIFGGDDDNVTVQNTIENIVENNVENNVEENNEINAGENKVEENKKDKTEKEDKEENIVKEDKKEDNAKEEEEKNNEIENKEKAIDLVKKEWGENDQTVYYYVEEQLSEDVYIISVRDQSTTEDLSSYQVNISSGTVKKD